MTQDPDPNAIFVAQRVLGFNEELYSEDKEAARARAKDKVLPEKLPSTWELLLTR